MALINLKKLNEILNKYPDDKFYYGKKEDTDENKFWIDLLKLSNYRCYYCGDEISIRNYDREHRIDKKIFGDYEKNCDYNESQKKLIVEINKEIKNSKYNLIPCCKGCNQRKKIIDKNKITQTLLKIKERNPSEKILKNLNDVKVILDRNDFLEENIELDFITLSLKNNQLKNNQLKFRAKILESIEKLISSNFKLSTNNYIDHLIVTENKQKYFEQIYYAEHLIFQKY